MFCFKCGADVSAQDTVCPVCGAPVNQTQASGDLPPAHREVSFRDRALSFAIDMLVMLGVWFVMFQFLYGVSFYLLPVVMLAYFTVTVGGQRAATFGQRCMKIRVVNTKTGGAPSYSKALLRAVFLLIAVGFLGLGCALYFVAGGRMLHDLVSGTRVVDPGE